MVKCPNTDFSIRMHVCHFPLLNTRLFAEGSDYDENENRGVVVTVSVP